jgi:hypothetical protein
MDNSGWWILATFLMAPSLFLNPASDSNAGGAFNYTFDPDSLEMAVGFENPNV